jgi:pimeloyl-ACP methyl ester carboxylesterase
MGGVAFLLAIRRPRRVERVVLDSYQSSRTLGRYPLKWFDWLAGVFPQDAAASSIDHLSKRTLARCTQKDRESARAGDPFH